MTFTSIASNWMSAGKRPMCANARFVSVAAAFGFLVCAQPAAAAETLGFVITTWNNAIYETKFIDECPQGMAMAQDEIWWRGLSKPDRSKFTEDGMAPRPERYSYFSRRGRDGTDACMDPTSVQDPPMLTVKGKTSYGIDLDGNSDGSATAKTCAHENFTSPDGKPGVDNQFYRLVGCVQGFRSIGYFDANPNESRKMQSLAIVLVEVSGVDDPRNDPEVDVTFHRSIDPYALDSTSKFVPYGSYRIDTFQGKSRYGDTVKGKIVDGVLTTNSHDARVPWFGNYTYQRMLIRDMQMRLEITPDGTAAKGELYGYYDIDQLMQFLGGIGAIHSDTFTDCAATYVAAYKLADGYPDPVTGKCTSLSAAWRVNAVAAYIIHPEQDEKPAAAAPGAAPAKTSWLGGTAAAKDSK